MKTNIILIDFENVQPKDLTNLRASPFEIRVFCGANQTKVPLDLAAQLQSLGPNANYVRIEGIGPNALDLHIAYYIGRLSSESPGSTFHIISKDKGFDPLIKHLAAQNIICHRSPTLADLAPSRPAAKSSPAERVQRVADTLLARNEGRPRTLKTLTAFSKAQLNSHASEATVAAVIALLTNAGLATGPQGKLTWPPK